MATPFLVPANRAVGTLHTTINDSDLSVVLEAGEGALFPSTYPYHITIDDEILNVTNRSTDTLTVTRAAESTTAAAHTAGAVVSLNITKQAIKDLNDAVNDIENKYFDKTILTEQGDVPYASAASTPAALAHGLDGQIFTTKGHGANPEWAFMPMYEIFHLPSGIGGYTRPSGTVTSEGDLKNYVTGASATNYAGLICANNEQLFVAAGKIIVAEWIIEYITSVTDVSRWFLITGATTMPPTTTMQHTGFFIDDANIHATNGDSSNGTDTDTTIDLATGSQRTYLRIVFNPGTDCKFYINNALVATHTTNLQTAGAYTLYECVRTDAAGAKNMYTGRVHIKRQY